MYLPQGCQGPKQSWKGAPRGVSQKKQWLGSQKDEVLGFVGSSYNPFISMTSEVPSLLQEQVGLPGVISDPPGPEWELWGL